MVLQSDRIVPGLQLCDQVCAQIAPTVCAVILGTSTGSAPSGQPNKGTPQKGPQRRINLHELTHGEYLALKHEVMQESNMYYNVYNSANGAQPSSHLLTEGHHVTEINNHESNAPNGQKGTNKFIVKTTTPTPHVEQADMRRRLQARQHEQISYPYQPHVLYAPGMYALDMPRCMHFPLERPICTT